MTDRVAAFAIHTLVPIARHLADSFSRLGEEVTDSARDIRSVAGALIDLKGLLREFEGQYQDPRFNRIAGSLLDDIILGVKSCSSTLRDLDKIVLRCNSNRRGNSPRSARKSWNEILSSFRNVEGTGIGSRLEEHKMFLFNIVDLLRNMYATPRTKDAKNKPELSRLRSQIRVLASQQQQVASRMKELEEAHLREISQQAEVYHNPHAYARYPPPPIQVPGQLPTPPLYDSPPRRPYSTPLPSPYAPPPLQDPYMRYDPRPVTPMTPISPISPLSHSPLTTPMMPRRYSNTPAPRPTGLVTPPTSPMSRQRPGAARAASKSAGNWWSDVFGLSPGHTSTLPEPPREGSHCFGMPMDTLAIAPEEHEIFRVEFDNDLMLRMFRNTETEAAKVVVTVGGPGGSWSNGRRNSYAFQTSIDATLLTITRSGPGIRLERRGMLWARLYFADYETLTLFYHAFLALRSRAPSAPVPKDSEYWLDGERLIFAAKIDDDGYSHVLRLLKDRESGSIRLAAARVDGDMDVTVWTAFITHQILTEDWMCYSSNPTSVLIHSIRQFSFSSCFETNMWREFDLRFCIPSDATDFANVVRIERRKLVEKERAAGTKTPGLGVGMGRNSYF